MELPKCNGFLGKPIVHDSFSGALIGGVTIAGCAVAAVVAGGGMASAMLIGGVAAATILTFSVAFGVWRECSSNKHRHLLPLQVLGSVTAGSITLIVGECVGIAAVSGIPGLIPMMLMLTAGLAVMKCNDLTE